MIAEAATMPAAIPMPLRRWLVPLILAVVVVAATLEMIRRRKLREEYAMLWLGTSLVLLVFAVFPNLVAWLSRLLQVNYLTIVVLACFLFLALIVLHYAVVISRQTEQIRQLAERVSLLQLELMERRGDNPGDVKDGDRDHDEGA